MTSSIGRIAAAFGIHLTKRDYERIGQLAVLEARAKFSASVSLKAVASCDLSTFIKMERWSLSQITERLLPLSVELDQLLSEHVTEFERLRVEGHDLRHRFIHAMWGSGVDQMPVAWDMGRELALAPDDLEKAVEAVFMLAKQAHRCVLRTGELIAEKRLAGNASEDDSAVRMFIKGTWVQF
jgi:hypothetical protein